MKLRFAASTWDADADQSFTLDVVAPPSTTDFHTGKDEGHPHHAELANLAAMARSIFHQVGATDVAQPEFTTLVSFNGTNGVGPFGSLIADAHGNLFGTTIFGGANGDGTVFNRRRRTSTAAIATICWPTPKNIDRLLRPNGALSSR